ncbi:MAG: hypothetical protein E4H02_10945 [Lentisphaerales bacterium]|nr:MAG: hypothetical protein E4H02_10945 [Lentisphaerales bacterium]
MHSIGFDKRSIIIDGKREFLVSGAVHYQRSTPELWPRIGAADDLRGYRFFSSRARSRFNGSLSSASRSDTGRRDRYSSSHCSTRCFRLDPCARPGINDRASIM